MMSNIISGQLNFRYHKATVFEHVEVDICEGDIVLVIGRNGAGKSTLLKLIARIEEIGKYSTLVNNLEKKDISYMASDLIYYSQMKIKDIFSFYHDMHFDFDKDYAYAYLEEFKISANKRISRLSDGERKIINFIICLSFNRKLYIIDEPFPNVDLLNDEILRKMIIEKYHKDTTFIIATHQINEFEKVSNKCLFIKSKREIEILNTDEIRNQFNCSIEDYFKERLKCLE
jgi:ABC-2 type transport system ATP-binding protein